MAQPPPYPGTEQKGYPPPPNPAYPPPQNPGYPPPQNPGYPPQQQGYGPPPAQGYAPGYAPQYGHGQQQQPQGYGQQQQYAGSTTVVVAQPTMAVVQQFREAPVHTRCPHCQAEVVTSTHYESGTLTWIICAVMCLVGLSFGCCLIPFCVDGCKDVVHSCPNCRQHVSRWSRM